MAPTPLNPWEVLDIDRTSDKAVIRQAYKKMVLRHHPDKVQQDWTRKDYHAEKFELIQSAWEFLSVDSKREAEDPQCWLDFLLQRRAAAQRGREKERERAEFIKFALQLFDEVDDRGNSAQPLTRLKTPKAPQSAGGGDDQLSKKIEEALRHQNRREATVPKATPELTLASKFKAKTATERQEKLHAVPPEQLNLERMNPDLDDAHADIIAVHGLGAIPDITWRENKSGVNWLSDKAMLPSATPKARIFRFGYDSLWMGDTPIRTTLSTIAIKLLLCLSVVRAVCLQRR
jgi:curved DNA-binding protein CbpA